MPKHRSQFLLVLECTYWALAAFLTSVTLVCGLMYLAAVLRTPTAPGIPVSDYMILHSQGDRTLLDSDVP